MAQLKGGGRLPKTRTLAELEDLFKKYEKAYKKIDMEAYAKYKKDVDVKGNWNIETKIHNYNYTKRRIDHFKKHGTDLLETKKNIVYYTKEKKKEGGSKYRGTKWEGVASQKEFLIKKVIDEEKVKKKRTKKTLTTEEQLAAKTARRNKKLEKKEKQFLEGKVELGEKLTPAQKKRLDTLNENIITEDAKKTQAKKDKAEALRVKKLDTKFEKMKAYISNAVKAIPKEEQVQEEEEPIKPNEPVTIEEILGFKAPDVVDTKPIKPIEVPKVIKQLKTKEELKKLFEKLKVNVNKIKEYETSIKAIDKTRAKLLKQKSSKITLDKVDEERNTFTKLLNQELSIKENNEKPIHKKDLILFRKFMKNPTILDETQPVKVTKPKPKTAKQPIIPIEEQLRVIAFETNKELLKETLRRSGLTKITIDAEPQQILDKFLKVTKERQENIINYYKNIIKEFEEEPKEERQSYLETIVNPVNPIYATKPVEKIPKYITPESEFIEPEEDEDEGEEEDIFDSQQYINFIENTDLDHERLFYKLEKHNYVNVTNVIDYLKITTTQDKFSPFRRTYDRDYEMRVGLVKSNIIDLKSQENKKFVRKVNDEISLMLKVLFLLENPNLMK